MAADESPGPGAWGEYLKDQRWFAGKGRRIVSVDPWDSIDVGEPRQRFGYRLIEVGYDSAPPERYALGLPSADDRGDSPREVGQTPARVRALLAAIAEQRTVDGVHGRLEFSSDATDPPLSGDVTDESIVEVRGEQSNRSTRVGDRWMLKEYRQLQPGPNPDRELPRALIRAGFGRVPRPVGGAVYRRGGVDPIDLISVTEFVPNRGDGWAVWGRWLRETPSDRIESMLAPEAEGIGRL
ncbi:trehalose synthase, partial [mine drainage metagenome]